MEGFIVAAALFLGLVWGYNLGKGDVLKDLELYGMYADKTHEFHVVRKKDEVPDVYNALPPEASDPR